MVIIGSIITVFITLLALYLLLASTGLFSWVGGAFLSKKDKIEKKMNEEHQEQK